MATSRCPLTGSLTSSAYRPASLKTPSTSLSDVFDPRGRLAQQIIGFQPRLSQYAMAEGVQNALRARSILVAEAGTGTGKTVAYLVPALLDSGKIVISTGTKNLQDQLFFKDLPLVNKALGNIRATALLKGRRNYLCRYRLDLYHGSPLIHRESSAHWTQLRLWAKRTQTGDVGEISSIPDESPLWPLATATLDNCLGQACPEIQHCCLVAARRKAQEADLVVINHHLFFADMSLKEGGFGEILPDADAFIFDEAHQLPEVATQYFGVTVSSRQIKDFLQDIAVETQASAPPTHTETIIKAQALEMALQELRNALDRRAPRVELAQVAGNEKYKQAMLEVQDQLNEFGKFTQDLAHASEGLKKCHARFQELEDRWQSASTPVADHVHYMDITRFGITLKMQPLDIAPRFNALLTAKKRAWIFTSATLSVEGEFIHFKRSLGIAGGQEMILDSPFNYAQVARLFIPPRLPEPRDPGHVAALVEATLPLVERNGGGTFYLFTSHRALSEAASLLATRTTRRLLVQGTQSRRVILDEFRRLGNAILLGTSSFWEGVDVRGPALSCVIIDKLPFAPPDEPLLKAKVNRMRQEGRDAFNELQVPLAILNLRQGIGRLIRDETDRGVLVIGDIRIVEKPYGKAFLNSLPPIPLTRNAEEVLEFMNKNEAVEVPT